ncbi:hypothetical protein PO124_29130 [Bacillus licheniformis]|nr:hypothetical protein [Bacillus licheniformis]
MVKYLGLCMLGLIQLFCFRADVDFPGELSGLLKTVAVILNSIAMFYLAGIIFRLTETTLIWGSSLSECSCSFDSAVFHRELCG